MPVPLNSVQLNVITVVDVEKAIHTGTLDGSLYMMDNSADIEGLHSAGQGSPLLSTTCTQGQVINWIIYPLVGPTSARISNIAFVDHDVCTRLEIYGAPDIEASPRYLPGVTPVYDYWAGMVLPDLAPGTYHYKLEIQMGGKYMYLESPSLNVIPLQ
ncbi:hypothetical protein IGB42_01187 [Andreprevotia sp. IGB-42]|uniref:hypothetical protein n=1 Tax=Andreprevotia sp. IGB-42 TaxID=2497473 RepID=UPI00135C8873|nr:hypothetical protein [Andreprevotia sp. IGB-42]KAF0814286.1 hypothetical protein IGB42_01187 [Andreprevotia sp. IGB-42]